MGYKLYSLSFLAMEYIEKFREQQHYNLTNLIDDFRIEASVTSFHTMVCDTKETIMNIIYGGHKKGYMRSLNFVTIWRTTIHEVELLLMIVKVIFIYHLLHIGFVCEWILTFYSYFIVIISHILISGIIKWYMSNIDEVFGFVLFLSVHGFPSLAWPWQT